MAITVQEAKKIKLKIFSPFNFFALKKRKPAPPKNIIFSIDTWFPFLIKPRNFAIYSLFT